MEILKHNTINIEDLRTGHDILYLSETNNEGIFKTIDRFNENVEVTLMGQGDSWSFESAEYLLDLILEHKEPLIKNMGYKDKDREKLRKLFAIVENSDLKLEFTNLVYREEDMDFMDGFEEFIWCSHDGCKVPADFSYIHKFTEGELRLIIDSILFSKNIDLSYRKGLIEKLESLSSKYFKSGMNHIKALENSNIENKDLFRLIEELDKAITNSKKVSFNYVSYKFEEKVFP